MQRCLLPPHTSWNQSSLWGAFWLAIQNNICGFWDFMLWAKKWYCSMSANHRWKIASINTYKFDETFNMNNFAVFMLPLDLSVSRDALGRTHNNHKVLHHLWSPLTNSTHSTHERFSRLIDCLRIYKNAIYKHATDRDWECPVMVRQEALCDTFIEQKLS